MATIVNQKIVSQKQCPTIGTIKNVEAIYKKYAELPTITSGTIGIESETQNVKIKIYDNEIDTNEMFIGCLIGDYTRTAISTMINTGTYIGMGCNIFGDGFQSKFIENFSWGKDDITEFDKFIDTLKIVKSRRAKYVSDSEFKLLKSIYENKN